MDIPYDKLSSEVLEGIIEEFITREGTDYGEYEYSLQQKVAQIKNQLERGQIKIIYDSVSDSCQLLPCDDGS